MMGFKLTPAIPSIYRSQQRCDRGAGCRVQDSISSYDRRSRRDPGTMSSSPHISRLVEVSEDEDENFIISWTLLVSRASLQVRLFTGKTLL